MHATVAGITIWSGDCGKKGHLFPVNEGGGELVEGNVAVLVEVHAVN